MHRIEVHGIERYGLHIRSDLILGEYGCRYLSVEFDECWSARLLDRKKFIEMWSTLGLGLGNRIALNQVLELYVVSMYSDYRAETYSTIDVHIPARAVAADSILRQRIDGRQGCKQRKYGPEHGCDL